MPGAADGAPALTIPDGAPHALLAAGAIPMTVEKFDIICRDFFEKLGEHADAVQVLASFYEGGTGGMTSCRKRGVGNYYARLGMAHEFIEQDKADEVGQSVARAMPKEES